MNETEYSQLPGVRATQLARLATLSPAHARVPVEATPEMSLGSRVHAEIFGQDLPYVVTDLPRRGTNEWKSLEQANPGKEIIKRADHEQTAAIVRAIRNHPQAGPLMAHRPAAIEEAIQWTDAATGLPCKARPDIRWPGTLLDLKTTSDVSPDAITRAIAARGYDIAIAHYAAGINAATGDRLDWMGWVFAETKPPYAVVVVRAGAALMDRGRDHYRRAMSVWAECEKSGVWPTYGTAGVMVAEPPKWDDRFAWM